MNRDLLQSVERYAADNTAIKVLSSAESERLRILVRDRFGFPEDKLWWWETMPEGAAMTDYGDADGIKALLSIVPNTDEEAYLFITDDEWPPWICVRGTMRAIGDMLREQPLFEYLVVSLKMTWIVFDTHHNALVSYGTKTPRPQQA